MGRLLFCIWLVFASSLLGAEPFLRGVTVSCQTYGPEWATPEMATTLDTLAGLGANAFAIHPYAQVREDGEIRFPANFAPAEIIKPARWAREKNLRMMLAPHLAYWGTKFSWRGEIDFAEPEQWARFFSGYTEWITGLAATCEQEKIPVLCIGLEYHMAVRHEPAWRALIEKVRAVYHGKITYGANWDDFAEVPFWDALDYVGILAYFPLCTVQQPDPDEALLRAGWKKWLARLADFSRRTGKPVLFTELGYNESSEAAAHPWDYKTGGRNAEEIQARCLRVALEETARADFLRGVFLWKWFIDLPQGQPENFDLRKPGPRAVIGAAWGNPT